jgi:integrase
MAIKATLRRKLLSENKESLYLDYYPPVLNPKTGKTTRREFLNMVIESEFETVVHRYVDSSGKSQKKVVPILNKAGNPKIRKLSSVARDHNKNMLELAERIKNKRINEINKPLIYSDLEVQKLKEKKYAEGNFVTYFQEEGKKRGPSERENWAIVHKYLNDFTQGNLPFYNLTEKFCEDFRQYLLTAKSRQKKDVLLNQNTACTYFVKFKAAVKKAWKEKKIPVNVGANVSTIKLHETQRNFLAIDELNKLVKTPCQDPILKRAFIFSCLTGLRKSDILNLTWSKLEIIDKKYAIRFTQQKTKGVETLWISEQAYMFLGERGEPEEKVFPGLLINSYYAKYLQMWLREAGIYKDISFHNARHTYATLQLSEGTDLKVVSKMLGHKSIRTTEIYAKVIDKLKQEAAERIQLDL